MATINQTPSAVGALCASRRSRCTLTLTNARADSPLVRLLLSMYIAQQSTNPVIKEMLVWGESGSPGPQHAEETGSRARAHTHRQGGPEPSGNRSDPSRTTPTVRTGWQDDRRATVRRLEPLDLAQRGCPVCARRAVARREGRERERERARGGGVGGEEAGKTEGREMCRFHDNKLR